MYINTQELLTVFIIVIDNDLKLYIMTSESKLTKKIKKITADLDIDIHRDF